MVKGKEVSGGALERGDVCWAGDLHNKAACYSMLLEYME